MKPNIWFNNPENIAAEMFGNKTITCHNIYAQLRLHRQPRHWQRRRKDDALNGTDCAPKLKLGNESRNEQTMKRKGGNSTKRAGTSVAMLLIGAVVFTAIAQAQTTPKMKLTTAVPPGADSKKPNIVLVLMPLQPWFDKSWKPGDFELLK